MHPKAHRREEPIALRQVLRFVARTAPAIVELASLKRPELIFRRTRYAGMILDERLLTRTFPWIPRAPTQQAFLLLSGRLRVTPHDGSATLSMSPGDVVLLSPADACHVRYEDGYLLDLEWTPARPPDGPPVRRLGTVRLEGALQLSERLLDGTVSDRALLADAIQLFRDVGAPLDGLSADTFEGGPSERDVRIARAIAVQIGDIRNSANALAFGECAELSPRQVQRIFAGFCERYRLNASSWRDMRNRYRLQIAVGLASIPSIPIATLADEVGYASPTALARAFAIAGFPPPSQLREELLRMRDV